MKTWEDLIKTLPTDETLEMREKSGTTANIDKKISLVEQEINNIKAKNVKVDEELERMFNDLNISSSTDTKTK